MNPPELESRITELWEELPQATGSTRADLLLELAHHLLQAERHSEAVPALEIAEELYLACGNDRLAGRAAHNRGVVLGHLERHDEVLAAEERSIELYERAQRRDLAGCSRMSLGCHLRNQGRLKQAVPLFRAALEDFRSSRELMHEGNALMALLEAEIDLGRFAAAERLLRPTREALATTAPIAAVATFHERAADVLEVRRGHDRAIAALLRARAVWDALDEDEGVARCDIRVAVLSLPLHGPEATASTLVGLRAERKEAGDPAGVAACDRGLGLVALHRRRPRRAGRLLRDAGAVFEACGLSAEAAECEALEAGALLLAGDADEARRRLRSVLPRLVRLHRPGAEARARLVLGRASLQLGDAAAAARQAKQAEAIGRRGVVNSVLDEARELLAVAVEARDAAQADG
jgi:tetratricopeptide (TPR) repeat protein